MILWSWFRDPGECGLRSGALLAASCMENRVLQVEKQKEAEYDPSYFVDQPYLAEPGISKSWSNTGKTGCDSHAAAGLAQEPHGCSAKASSPQWVPQLSKRHRRFCCGHARQLRMCCPCVSTFGSVRRRGVDRKTFYMGPVFPPGGLRRLDAKIAQQSRDRVKEAPRRARSPLLTFEIFLFFVACFDSRCNCNNGPQAAMLALESGMTMDEVNKCSLAASNAQLGIFKCCCLDAGKGWQFPARCAHGCMCV